MKRTQPALPSEGDQRLAIHAIEDARSVRYHDGRLRRRVGAVILVELIHQLPRRLTDRLDQRRHPQRPPDVVDVEDQHHDAQHDQDEGHHDGETGHRVARFGRRDSAHRQHGVGERRDEDADRQLARRSRRIARMMRGENWPIASCTRRRGRW
jgi:hypothetical protein